MHGKHAVPALLLSIAAALWSCGGIALAADAGAGDDPHAAHRAMRNEAPATGASSASVSLHDGPLLTQYGEPVNFVGDVLGDRIVIIDFVYTTCTTVCPVLSAIFSQIQRRLGDRLGGDIHMVSISVDPVRDTPERLSAYAAKLQARPGWIWLTGEKTSVDNVLRGLGAYTPDFEDHPSMILVGDMQSGTWQRFFGFPGPDKILAVVEELQTARQVARTRQ